jgi:hypothetical protein
VTGTAGNDSITAPGTNAFLFANQQQLGFSSTIIGVDVTAEFDGSASTS